MPTSVSISAQPSALVIQPVAVIHTPYKEKFSVPRQPNLVPDGVGVVELLPPYNQPDFVRGLEQFSHLWLIFQFDRIAEGKWQPTVRPPRLGGNQRVGVFASRATHRPNPLGLSKVELKCIECKNGKVLLHLGAVDLVDGTPIFDIKPYLAYADSEPNAQSGFAQHKPEATLQVQFSAAVKAQLKKYCDFNPRFRQFIQDVLAQDPRPAYQQGKITERIYGVKLGEFDVRWRMLTIDCAEVIELVPLTAEE